MSKRLLCVADIGNRTMVVKMIVGLAAVGECLSRHNDECIRSAKSDHSEAGVRDGSPPAPQSWVTKRVQLFGPTGGPLKQQQNWNR
jgi:hypothetical protein